MAAQAIPHHHHQHHQPPPLGRMSAAAVPPTLHDDDDDDDGAIQLAVGGIPSSGAKSRVETQVKLTLAFPPAGSSSTNSGSTAPAAAAYTHVRLQPGTATKRKSRKQVLAAPEPDPPSASTLWLTTEVYCATEGVPDRAGPGTLGGRVFACGSCRSRELKRSQRKLTTAAAAAGRKSVGAAAVAGQKQQQGSDSDVDSTAGAGGVTPSSKPPIAAAAALAAKAGSAKASSPSSASALSLPPAAAVSDDERNKIVLFNCSETLEIVKGEVGLPARVTCYCRHHREKLGFIIKFIFRNSTGAVVAVAKTPPLMITDDHKSSEKSTEAAAKAAAAAAAAVGLPAPLHIGTPVGAAGGRGQNPKALIMPSNPPAASKAGAMQHVQQSRQQLHQQQKGPAGPAAQQQQQQQRASHTPASFSTTGSAATSRTHTNGTLSPSFTLATSSSVASTPFGTPLPPSLPLPRGTKRAQQHYADGSGSATSDDSSATSDATHHHPHHHHRKRTATSAVPYDRRSSPAGSSLSGASSVLGTPHFPAFGGAGTALPQMEDDDDGADGAFGFALHDVREVEVDDGSSSSGGGAGGRGVMVLDGGGLGGSGCAPTDMRLELGMVDDMLFSLDQSQSAGGDPLKSLASSAAGSGEPCDAPFARGHAYHRPSSASTYTTTSDADMSFSTAGGGVIADDGDGEAGVMSFDSLVDYEGGSGMFSPPASVSTSSRRETSASSGTSSDSDSLLGPSATASAGAFGAHSHWPSIYPSAHNNPNNIQIPYPHPYLLPVAPPPPPLPRPSISRLIPAEGPLAGGIDVTLLGVNFLQGMTAWFGETQATATHCWNDGTVVVTVPPGVVAGPVPVVLKMEGRAMEAGLPGAGSQLFTYKDSSDRALLELALQVVGLKMTGRIEDAKNVALRILGQGAFATGIPAASTSSSAPGAAMDSNGAPSEKSTLQRLESAYQGSAIVGPDHKTNFALPPLAVSSSSTTAATSTSAADEQQKEKKERPTSWAAATAAQARRVEREIARYGYYPSSKRGAKNNKSDKMLWFFWLPVLICFAVFFAITQLPTLLVDAKRIGSRYLPFKALLDSQ